MLELSFLTQGRHQDTKANISLKIDKNLTNSPDKTHFNVTILLTYYCK